MRSAVVVVSSPRVGGGRRDTDTSTVNVAYDVTTRRRATSSGPRGCGFVERPTGR